MSKSRLLREMSSREIAEWIAYFKVETALEKKQDSAEVMKAKFQSLVPQRANSATGKNKR